MSDSQELLNVVERCRICLTNRDCMISLQSCESKLKDLTKCTCIDIKYEKNLPTVVCHICLYKLDMWSEFKERFIKSNKILLEQLEMSEESDNVKNSSQDESCEKNAERKRKIDEGNNSDTEKKKSKLEPSLETTNITDTGQVILDTIYISSDENDDNKSDSSKPKKDATNDEAESKIYSGPARNRLLPARRGRNIERRKASTKRWVERKKALMAAVGETVSDTDSIASDDMQLSPVQKARAKTNADKELEKQKKVAKVLKNLESNLSEKYIAFRDKDTDSDTRRTRFSKEHSNTLQQRNKNSLLKQVNKKNVDKNRSSLDSSLERENSLSPLTNSTPKSRGRKPKMQTNDQNFTPHSMKSELVIGDTIYAVTSTLILVDPNDKADFNNSTKDSKNLDENNQNKNTDIIDAVQLRRINPVINVNDKSNSKFMERCLNIEVEGSELAVLKRVQYELANFVEKDIKNKLFDIDDSGTKAEKTDNTTNNICLRQKLKDIIELTIKKNIESCMIKQGNNDQESIFSSTMLKIAMDSFEYQPRVILKRIDIAEESKHYNINNPHALKSRTKLPGPFNTANRKRQSVLPVKYDDYNITALDSDSEPWNDDDDDEDVIIPEKPKSTITKISNPAMRQSAIIVNKSIEKKKDEQKADKEVGKIEGTIIENHICGVCGLTFHSREDVAKHVRTHKTVLGTVQVNLQNDIPVPPVKPRQNKQKLMRCKRCHEIVEARFVKVHVCKTLLHKCYVCDSMFRTKNLLAKHLESHDQSDFNIANAIENKKIGNADALLKILSATTLPQKDQTQKTAAETDSKTQTFKNEKNDIQSDKISSTGVKLDNTENTVKPKETYTCFVCDKIFTDEEILKDHLQKHCDDLSEGEQSTKEQYQCAICGSTLDSDHALEEHVGKHLFDDEDDNPNLISIDQDTEYNAKTKEIETYQCGQCSETFDSEILLEMHMQAHEEEDAIAEWEKQGMKVYQYQCMLCDELFNTKEELAEHLDIHNTNAQVCQLCDKPFRTLEDLQEHVATH